MIIRPVQRSDLEALYHLAGSAGIGLTTLPRDEAFLAARIDQACMTFQRQATRAETDYLFVMENEQHHVVGVSGIAGEVGNPWYSYRVDNVTRSSASLGVSVDHQTLRLSESTQATELCSLFLHPDARNGLNGRLLSKARFLFLAEYRNLFCKRVIAEMRGVSDPQGVSPFWEHMGRPFFGMAFDQADRLSGLGNREFIADLIPREPIYLSMLPLEAREVIGQTHQQTRPARRLLEEEGFRYHDVIDIFDGGPTLECPTHEIRAVAASQVVPIVSGTLDDDATPWLIANRGFEESRITAAPAAWVDQRLVVAPQTLNALVLSEGQWVRAVPVFTQPR